MVDRTVPTPRQMHTVHTPSSRITVRSPYWAYTDHRTIVNDYPIWYAPARSATTHTHRRTQ
eukprot:358741-Prymnesium_polylepis.2